MPALADGCVPPLRQVVDEVDLGGGRCGDNLFLGRRGIGECDVLTQRARK